MENGGDVLVSARGSTDELDGDIDEGGEEFGDEVGENVGLLAEAEGADTLERGKAACVDLPRVRADQQLFYFLCETRPVVFGHVVRHHIFQCMCKLHCHSPRRSTRQQRQQRLSERISVSGPDWHQVGPACRWRLEGVAGIHTIFEPDGTSLAYFSAGRRVSSDQN